MHGDGHEGTATAGSLGLILGGFLRLVGQSCHFSLLLVTDPIPIALTALLGSRPCRVAHELQPSVRP